MRPAPALAATLLTLAVAPSPAQAHTVPVRDGRVTADGPRAGWAYACDEPAPARARASVPWLRDGRFDHHAKPVVGGELLWPAATFDLELAGGSLTFTGNGQPVDTPTGIFPPSPGDATAAYAGDAAALTPRAITGLLSRSPRRTRGAQCLDPDLPIGIARNGVPIRPPFDASGRNALAYEVQDRCGGRTDATGVYFYRAPSDCLDTPASARSHSPLVGYARDGFGIFGRRGTRGRVVGERGLDACHGHTHRVQFRGRLRRIYHYHVTSQFPYSIGCFRGRPARGWTIGQPDLRDPVGGPPPLSDLVVNQTEPPASDSPAPASDSPAPAFNGPTTVTADPELFPAFDPAVTDYVTRCSADTPVQLSVTTAEARPVAVDGAAARSGTFTAPVQLDTGQRFAFTVGTGQQATTHHVRCLPPNFPTWTVSRAGPTQAEWYLTAPAISPLGTLSIVFDGEGVPVWWLDSGQQPLDFKLLPNGNVIWHQGSLGSYVERSLDGQEVRQLRTVGYKADPHDIVLLPNGNYLLMTYMPRDHVDLSRWGGPADATVQDGELQELTPAGALVWSWNTKDHVALEESDRWAASILNSPALTTDGRTAYDITHINAAEVRGNEIVISLRHTDAIYSIDRISGDITWKLGGTTTPGSLAFIGDPLGAASFGGQHDPRWEPDGTITVFDNGTARNRAPRAVRYEIDTDARTATLVEDIRDAAAPTSGCCGSARKMSGGNWVVGWGRSPHFAELAPDGTPLFRITFGGTQFSYRSIPLEPGELSRDALRTGMDAMFPR